MHFTYVPLRALKAISGGEKYNKVFIGDVSPFHLEPFVNFIAACPRDKRPEVVAVGVEDKEAAEKLLGSFHAMQQPAFWVTGEWVERAFRAA